MDEVYFACDIITDPPTNIEITKDVTSHGQYTLRPDDIQKTAGWEEALRGHRRRISICLSHSFGKCCGKTNGQVETCQQIHVLPEKLRQLRSLYLSPMRQLLSRTVKARLSNEMMTLIDMHVRRLCGRIVQLEYLEFRVSEMEVTDGLFAHEERFRKWLQDPEAGPQPHHSTSFLCDAFVLPRSACAQGERCSKIHANPSMSMARDRMVIAAIQQVCTFPSTPPQVSVPFMMSTTSPSYNVTPASLSTSSLQAPPPFYGLHNFSVGSSHVPLVVNQPPFTVAQFHQGNNLSNFSGYPSPPSAFNGITFAPTTGVYSNPQAAPHMLGFQPLSMPNVGNTLRMDLVAHNLVSDNPPFATYVCLPPTTESPFLSSYIVNGSGMASTFSTSPNQVANWPYATVPMTSEGSSVRRDGFNNNSSNVMFSLPNGAQWQGVST